MRVTVQFFSRSVQELIAVMHAVSLQDCICSELLCNNFVSNGGSDQDPCASPGN